MKSVSLIAAIFAFLSGCALDQKSPEEACGFRQNVYGERISWKNGMTINVRLHSSVSDAMVPAILAAAESWNAAAGRQLIRIIENPRVDGENGYTKDNVNVIYFKDEWTQKSSNIQAETRISWIDDVIIETDIIINGEYWGFYWEGGGLSIPTGRENNFWYMVNLEAVMLHEFGHVLGLDHSEEKVSVMSQYLSGRSNRITLDQSSLESIKCEY